MLATEELDRPSSFLLSQDPFLLVSKVILNLTCRLRYMLCWTHGLAASLVVGCR